MGDRGVNHSWDTCLNTEAGMCEIATQVPQPAVDAAFPILHGGHEFRDSEASLRADCERPVREALAAAGLLDLMSESDHATKATAERDRYRAALEDIIATAGPVDAPQPAVRLDAIVGRARGALEGDRRG